jgi:hypothetical protein
MILGTSGIITISFFSGLICPIWTCLVFNYFRTPIENRQKSDYKFYNTMDTVDMMLRSGKHDNKHNCYLLDDKLNVYLINIITSYL